MSISNKQIEYAYEIAKKVYNKDIDMQGGISKLHNIGMNETTANIHIKVYFSLIEGKVFKRAINKNATDYYLRNIFKEKGEPGLQKALIALENHLNYYEARVAKVIGKWNIYNKYKELLSNTTELITYNDEISNFNIQKENLKEGSLKTVFVNSFERNPIARKKCIEHYGYKCQVCDFDFRSFYGEIGKDFIHVHHKIEISSIKKEYVVDPVKDLIPVCPNCHAMLHKRNPAFTVEELKNLINKKN
jgi:5-methylcytosine-specific restriction protein A